MTSVYNVIGALCERAEWSLSNLSIQKSAYLVQLLYLGERSEPLFPEDFEAWDYGPVVPNVYHKLKMFGSAPVKPMSYLSNTRLPNDAALRHVDDVARLATTQSPGKLVAITHWENGAWAKHYERNLRGIVIPKSDIRDEYRARAALIEGR